MNFRDAKLTRDLDKLESLIRNLSKEEWKELCDRF
jgi:hypothetical protein